MSATRAGLAALLLAAAASPALAQSYGNQGYGNQGYGSQGYGGQPAAGYDRQGYPPSTYDRGATSGSPPSGGYRGDDGRYGGPGQQGGYDQGGGGADDPEALARQLNLTPSQRSAYQAYQAAFRPDEARARQEEDDMRRMASLPTPQRLEMARASLARDRADFDRTDAATRAFYAQLSPAQRRTFDQLTAPQMDDGGPDGGPGGPSPTQPAARPPR